MTALVVRRSPSLIKELERVFEPTYLGGGCCGCCMSVDLYEDKDDLVLKAELPGVGKDSFDVRLEGDMLRIEAEKKVGEQTRERTYLSERDFGRLSRTLTLPFPVDAAKASATLENGVLQIRLPKAEEAKSKRIEVK